VSDWYRRDGSGPIPIEEVGSLQWGGEGRVANDTVGEGADRAQISTVFLGLDHQWGDGPPLIFETMVFGGRFDQSQERYPTEEAALAGHARWVAQASQPSPTPVIRLAALISGADDTTTDNALALAEHLLAAGVTIPEEN
jgi:hypothetical protein